jgi:TPR repeat protein
MDRFFERIDPILGTPTLPMSEEERAERFDPVGEEVKEAFEESYRRGYRWAAYWLGEMHRIGLGVKRDPAKAAFWYEKAGRTGSARLRLGFCLLNGVGVDKDETRAAKLFLEDGSWESRVLLGRMFLDGRGVVRSPLAAVRLFRSLQHEDLLHPSSLECSPDSYAAGRIAAETLAEVYRKGIGVKKDEGWAEYWERMSRGEFDERD